MSLIKMRSKDTVDKHNKELYTLSDLLTAVCDIFTQLQETGIQNIANVTK